jgi:LPS export ABC transporter protein LptC
MTQEKIQLTTKEIIKAFQSKHGTKVAMLVPFILFILFFGYSAVSALLTVNSSKLPKDFEKIDLEVQNYKLEQLDQKSKQRLWKLNAKSAKLDPKYNNAEIVEPVIEYYDKDSGKVKFLLSSDTASLNKQTQAFKLFKNVQLHFNDNQYYLESGNLEFSEQSQVFKTSNNWSLESLSKGLMIKGSSGVINKDFKTLISEGSASLTKAEYLLEADKIAVNLTENSQTVDAVGHSKLNIRNRNITLRAQQIHLDPKGNLKANGAINILTEKVSCFANNLLVRKINNIQIATLTGNPYIVRNGDKIFADEIDYNFDTEEVTIKGNVHS